MARPRPVVLAIGDAIVDFVTPSLPRLPRGDAQLAVRRIHVLPGGNATNFALQMAALGARSRFVGAVGGDPLARVLHGAFRSRRVGTRLRVVPSRPTGSTIAITWTKGRRVLVTAPGANEGLRERDIPPSAFRGVDHVHRAGFWWATGMIGRPTVRVLKRAAQAGSATSLDIATDPLGWPAARTDLVRDCLPHVTTFLGNEEEVSHVGGARDPLDAAREICRLGAEEVVVHRGVRGATWVRGDQTATARGFRVRALNPTGCGDVFNAGYVFSRLKGREVRGALSFANACAALHLRDWDEPYPGASSVDRFLKATR